MTATTRQQEYIECLLIDCGFGTRAQRNAYLEAELGHPVKFLDELTVQEASKAIDLLRELKEEKWEAQARRDA